MEKSPGGEIDGSVTISGKMPKYNMWDSCWRFPSPVRQKQI